MAEASKRNAARRISCRSFSRTLAATACRRSGAGCRVHESNAYAGRAKASRRPSAADSRAHNAHTRFTGDILDGSRWAPWFAALAKRLERVVVLNRSWESAVTPTLLQQTPSAPKPPVAIFLDPPYLTHDRDQTIYHGDEDADAVARAALAWAVEHGDRYRIAYACGAKHFDVPDRLAIGDPELRWGARRNAARGTTRPW